MAESRALTHLEIAQGVDRHLAAHHGIISRSEALQLGMSNAGVARRRKAESWHAAGHSVFRAASHPDTWHSRARAAAIGLDALVSHRAALHLWGIDDAPRSKLEVTIPFSARRTASDVCVHRTKQPGLMDPTCIDAIPVTGLSRTILDTAAVVGPRRLDFIVDAVLRQKMLDWPDLYEVCLLYTSPSPRDRTRSRMPSSA